jgi:hypothetical protein
MPISGTSYPSSTSGSGAIGRNGSILSGHIFNAGLEMPDVSPILTLKYPQYYLQTLAEKIKGVSVAQGSKVHTWYVQDRTRKGAAVSSVANGTTATATITTDITYDTSVGNYGYFLVGDLIRVSTGENGIITAISGAGGVQTIDVVRYGGGSWSTTLLPTSGAYIGHIATAFAEGSSDAGGVRSYLPTEEYNVMQILRRKFKVTSDMLNQKTWIDDKTWYFKQEDFEQKEFMRDVEALLVFGKRYNSGTLTGTNTTRGLMEYAEGSGVNVGFSSAVGVQEADLSNFLKQIYTQDSSNDLIALCGEQFLFDVNHTLADRYRAIPQSEKPAELAGLNFQSYEIGGKKIHFSYYQLFSDSAVVPQVTPSSTAKDFRNTALVLDFGTTEGGERNIQLRYRDGETGSRKMVQKMIPGMASPGLEVSNAYDGLEGQLLAEVMPKVVLPNRLGLIYANS